MRSAAMGVHMRQVTNQCQAPAKVPVRWDNHNRNDLPGFAGFFIDFSKR
jgi:hypothetical protein